MKKKSISKLNLSLIILMFGASFSCKNHVAKRNILYNVSGKVSQNKLYCGGARPTEEMKESLKQPIAYPNKSFYIKESDSNTNQTTLLKFTSDSLGNFTFQLKPGNYAIFVEEQINKADFSAYKNLELNQTCYDKWLKKPYTTIEVTNANINDLAFKIDKKCFIPIDIPCLTYTGPRPQ